MKIYISDTDNPFFNLAFEEWAVKNYDASEEDLMILYINKPSVVVGRNQNIFEEVNLKYCAQNNIEICRRVSGGGTVFHDYGNINWAIISKYDTKKVNQYKYFAQPLLDFLKKININAYLNERNGIEVNGLKISGQAQFASKMNILSHGTLLVSSELENMQLAIEPERVLTIESKASKSVRSMVVNINSLLNSKFLAQEILLKFNDFLNANYFNLSDINYNEIREINKKYSTKDWVIGKSPKSKITVLFKDKNEEIIIEKGKIIQSTNKSLVGISAFDFLVRNFF